MIRAQSQAQAYRTSFTSKVHEASADAPVEKGGQGAGFDPHELLEAALATCLNIVIRKTAVQMKCALESVCTSVRVDRSNRSVATFDYEVELKGQLSDTERQSLLDAARHCPVSETLSKRIEILQRQSGKAGV